MHSEFAQHSRGVLVCSLVPSPIPVFSACNIEKTGIGLGTRLLVCWCVCT
jgi:hypothetical protein